MPKPRIFISHSAKDAFTVNVRDQLYEALKTEEFEPLLDKERLESGKEWRTQLRTWLGLCHGAIILFSKNIFETNTERLIGSPWVLNEASILIWRRELDKNFFVLPIMLPGVEVTALNNGLFEPLNLPEIQAISVQEATDEMAKDIVERIVKRLHDLKDKFSTSPFQRLEKVIVDGLKKLDQADLEDVAQELAIDLGPWRADEQCATAFVRALFHREIDVIAKAIELLAPYPSVDKKTLYNMRDILTAFWIDPAAVASIPRVVLQPEKQRAISLRASQPIIASMYIQRACCTYPSWPDALLNNDAGTDAAGRLTLEIIESLRDRLKLYDRGKPRSDSDVKQHVRKMYGAKPLFVIIPNFVDVDVLAKVREEFPTVTFFLLFQQDLLDFDVLQGNYINYLQPELSAEQAETVANLYDYTKQFVE